MRLRRILLHVVAFATALSLGTLRGADESTLKFFRELRLRRLYSLAERYCLDRLGRPGLSAVDRADLTIELADTLVEHSAYVSDDQQEEMWRKAKTGLKELLQADPENPRRLLLDAHAAMIPAAEGHWSRWQAELQPDVAEELERAQTALNEAIPRLTEVEGKLRARLSSSKRATGEGEPLPFELQDLLVRISFQRAQALVDLARLPTTSTADRADHLVRAEKLLRTGDEDSDLIWESRVLHVECLRLMGETVRARRALTGYIAQDPPEAVADRLTVEKIQLLLAEGQTDEAELQLEAALKKRGAAAGELALVQVQRMAAKWTSAHAKGESGSAALALSHLQQRVEEIQREVAGYWAYRCSLVLQQVQLQKRFGVAVAPLVRRAETAFSRNQQDQAAKLYAEAEAAVRSAGKLALAFDLGYTRASILAQSQNWQACAEALGTLLTDEVVASALNEPSTRDKAPDALLLHAFALGKLFGDKPTQARRVAYSKSLERIRAEFADKPQAHEAAWMLGDLEERRDQATAALQLYDSIPLSHPRGPAAQVRVAECYVDILRRLVELKRPAQAWEAEAIKTLTGKLPSPREGMLSRTQAELAIILAQILLQKHEPDYSTADQWLARASESLKGQADAASLSARAMRLRVVSLAGQGSPPAARSLLDQLSVAEPQELLAVLEGLMPLAKSAPEGLKRELGALQVQAALKLRDKAAELSAPEQARLEECLALAYVATDQFAAARDIYAVRLKAAPRDKQLLQSQGDLLERTGTLTDQVQALELWKRLESLEKAGTPAWLAARLRVCQALARLKRIPEAMKLVKVTKLLYPKLGDEATARGYANLEGKLKETQEK